MRQRACDPSSVAGKSRRAETRRRASARTRLVSATLPAPCRALRFHRPKRSPSSTWARTASGSRSGASKATRSSASTPGARTLRIGAGIDERGRLAPEARRAALACLARFGERIKGLHPSAVRAVATNTFRVATNAATFLPQAERALGFPIDIITGHEEARLIYNGVAHVLPASTEPRLVIDIGGGSTEFIIGRGLEPERLESLQDRLRRHDAALLRRRPADRDRRSPPPIPSRAPKSRRSRATSSREHWTTAYASSGTALALAEILEQNGLSAAGITPDGLARLRKRMVGAGHVERLRLAALKPERAPVLAGGPRDHGGGAGRARRRRASIRSAARCASACSTIFSAARSVATSGSRRSSSSSTRYRIDREHAARVAAMAVALHARALPGADPAAAQRLEWAALLHETGFSVSHTGFHKHGAYILQNADMPGFSARRAARPRAPRAGLPRRPRRRWRRRSPTRAFARACSRCGSPCCSTMRGGRSRRPRSRSSPGPDPGRACRRAG